MSYAKKLIFSPSNKIVCIFFGGGGGGGGCRALLTIIYKLSLIRTFKGNRKKLELSGVRVFDSKII